MSRAVSSIWLGTLALGVTLLMAGCGSAGEGQPTPVGPTATISASVTAEATGTSAPASHTPDLSGSKYVYIQNDWTGLSAVAPVNAHYTLTGGSGGFKGSVQFSVAGYTHALSATDTIDIPADIASQFLSALSNMPMQEGPYTPNIGHTDDYPDLRIVLRADPAGPDTITFASTSQGDGHVPWQVRYNNREYVVNSDAPERALELLAPYVKADTMNKLIENAENRKP